MRYAVLLAVLVMAGLSFPEALDSCSVIDSSGDYQLSGDLSGAPQALSYLGGEACLRIISSDVAIDCAGHSITGSGLPGTYGIATDGSTFRNVTIKNCVVSGYGTAGVLLWGPDHSLSGNTADRNGDGFQLLYARDARVSGNTLSNNSGNGLYASFSDGLVLSGTESYGNSNGFYLYAPQPAHIEGIQSHGNSNLGMFINSGTIDMNGSRFYGDGEDFGETNSALDFSDVIFDGDAGSYTSYSNVSLHEEAGPTEDCRLNWASMTPPAGLASFNGMSLAVSGCTVDSLTFHWSPGMESGYEPSSIGAWEDTGTLSQLNGTLSAGALSLSGVPAGKVGVFARPGGASPQLSSCSVISSPGEYQLAGDLSGAPNQYNHISSGGATWTYKACILVDSDDVSIDCAGHSISGSAYNLSAPDYVLTSAIYSGRDNVTVENCDISGYAYGIDGRNATMAITGASFSHIPVTGISLYYDSNQGTQTGYDNATMRALEFRDLAQATNIMGYYDVELDGSTMANISSSVFNFYQITGRLGIDDVNATGFSSGGPLAADRLSLTNSRFEGGVYGTFGTAYVRYAGLIENDTFSDSSGTALWLSTPFYGGPSSATVVLRGNRFSGNQQSGQFIYASSLDRLEMERNSFSGGGRGAYLTHIGELVADNNTFTGLKAEGIQADHVSGGMISGTSSQEVAGDSIAFIYSKNITVDDAAIAGASHGMGIRMDYCSGVRISGVDIDAAGRTNSPIWVQGSNDTEISMARIYDSPYSISINGAGTRDIYIHGVEISNVSSPGTSALYLPGVSGAVVRDVSIRNPYYGIYLSDNAKDVLIENVSVSDPVYVGAYVSNSRLNLTFDRDMFSGAGLDPVNIQPEGAGISSYNASFQGEGNRLFGNRYDLLLRGSNGPEANVVALEGTIFDNPAGTMENYSNVTLTATVDGKKAGSPPNYAGEAIVVNWSSSAPPVGMASFHNMWVSVQNLPALYYYTYQNASVDSFSMAWREDQEQGYPGPLQMWQESGNWTMLDGTPESRTLSASNVGAGKIGILYPAVPDSDNDGVNDQADKCPGTILPEKSVPSQSLLPNAYAVTGTDGYFMTNAGSAGKPAIVRSAYNLSATYGCTCEQILYCKPGNSEGEYKFGCSQGTMSVWIGQSAWATDCQVNGKVARRGEEKSIFTDTDGSILPDILDGDDDNDGVWDAQDIEADAKPAPNGSTTGKPDWWCAEHRAKC